MGDLSTAYTNTNPTTKDLLGTMRVHVQVENMGYTNTNPVGDQLGAQPDEGHQGDNQPHHLQIPKKQENLRNFIFLSQILDE